MDINEERYKYIQLYLEFMMREYTIENFEEVRLHMPEAFKAMVKMAGEEIAERRKREQWETR